MACLWVWVDMAHGGTCLKLTGNGGLMSRKFENQPVNQSSWQMKKKPIWPPVQNEQFYI